MVTLRRALPSEASMLTRIAIASKAHWGYDLTFMNAVRDEITITEQHIQDSEFVAAERGGELVAFYNISGEKPNGQLTYMWVLPSAIGQGLGRLLWSDAMKRANEQGYQSLKIDADPHAEGFYRKMGAKKIGEVKSGSIEGRILPLMEVTVTAQEQ